MYSIDDLKRGIEGMRGCSGFEPKIDTDPITGEIILRTNYFFKDKNSSGEIVPFDIMSKSNWIYIASICVFVSMIACITGSVYQLNSLCILSGLLFGTAILIFRNKWR